MRKAESRCPREKPGLRERPSKQSDSERKASGGSAACGGGGRDSLLPFKPGQDRGAVQGGGV